MAARRAQHKAAHPPGSCPNGAFSWVECDNGARESFGRCTALTEKANECTKWAMDQIGERRYCNQHAAAIVEAELRAHRASLRQADLDERITAFLAWTAEHPSVWDRRVAPAVGVEPTGPAFGERAAAAARRSVDGADGESNPVSPKVEEPGTEAVSAGPTGSAAPRGPNRSVVWSALSGNPMPVDPKRR